MNEPEGKKTTIRRYLLTSFKLHPKSLPGENGVAYFVLSSLTKRKVLIN
jgi:hypothetical protein